MTLAPPVEDVLRRGVLCYVAASAHDGPHLTPVVFALDGGLLWITTSRGSRKARLWRRDPSAAGLVRFGDRAVSFRGEVTSYDLLEPSTWGRSAVRSPLLSRAALRFTRKNLRFFAGYARDAHRVPLSWTPPGRVFLSISLSAGALLDLGLHRSELAWGWREREPVGRRTFRPRSAGPGVDDLVEEDLRERLGSAGEAVAALGRGPGMTVLPVGWAREEAGIYDCVLSRSLLALAPPDERAASLVLDRASRWRASHMEGVQLRGPVERYLLDEVTSGRRPLRERAERAGPLPPEPAVLRLRPGRAVWWKGWSSGTVGLG